MAASWTFCASTVAWILAAVPKTVAAVWFTLS
eukprot:CAMPEP_0170605502 /NCGR_PEP_ID=MMETSP0224-20130122/20007_1 /TAXON_ID=285029 /ORGANISM="Togula jolla, Strain CCCM 725" /LENGTH=31 /DNA_ID= /DNA_START= /DNA_END= /DNA_ORIENTATION=